MLVGMLPLYLRQRNKSLRRSLAFDAELSRGARRSGGRQIGVGCAGRRGDDATPGRVHWRGMVYVEASLRKGWQWAEVVV